MKKQTFIIVCVAAVVAIALAWWLNDREQPDDTLNSGVALLPSLSTKVNEVRQITIHGAANTLIATLNKGDEHWTVAERDGFRADWERVRSLLRGLAEAEIVEHKTARTELFPRLGVEDVSAEDAAGVLVRLESDDEYALIIGNAPSDGSDHRYVRKLNGPQALLVDQRLDVPQTPENWIDRDVFHFAAERIAEIFVRHADGEVLHMVRDESAADAHAGGASFTLQGIPEGREVGSPWSISAFSNSLTNLQVEDARAATAELPEEHLSVLFVADNELNLQLELYQEENQHWLRISANAEPVTAGAMVTEGAADVGNEASTDSGAGDEAERAAQAAPSADEEARAINQLQQGWEYRIAEFKYNGWAKSMEDLLAPLPDEENDGEAGGNP